MSVLKLAVDLRQVGMFGTKLRIRWVVRLHTFDNGFGAWTDGEDRCDVDKGMAVYRSMNTQA